MNDELFYSDALQDDKVIEVPVEDARQPQFAHVAQVELQGPGNQIKLSRCLDQASQRRALKRNRKAVSQAQQVSMVPVITSYHRKASQPAFSGFGL
jgi:hypothetical protein